MEYVEGRSPALIARDLNKEGVPSPRVGQRHKAFGLSGSTIRAMLRNERYIGVWKFGERRWVKVPARTAGNRMRVKPPK